jgi:hypothetical protein
LLVDGGTPNPYLKAVFAADPFFSAHRVPDGNVDYASLNTYPVIILSDIAAISTGLSQQLKTYVSKGGTLLVFPGGDADIGNYKSFLQSLNAAYPEKLVTAAAKVATINLQNPVFKSIFENFPQNPDLPAVKKYYQLSGGGESLMALPGRQPFWSQFTNGKGRVYVSAVALTEDFSNLPRHALFVPIMFRIALLSGHDQPLAYTLGSEESIEVPPVQTTDKELLKLVKGSLSIIPEAKQIEGSTLLYTADQLQQPGIYDLKKQDSTVAVLAFNDNRSESDLTYLSVAELAKLVPDAKPVLEAGKGSLKNVLAESNFGLQLWKLCIILALIFLAAEILLIRYFRTDIQPVPQRV